MKMFPLILSFAAALFAGCGEKPNVDPEPPVPPVPDGPVATVYTTSVAGKRFDESSIALKKPDDVHFYKVERSGETFQEVDGFGLAITQASCYNLLLMQETDRTAFLTELFSREEPGPIRAVTPIRLRTAEGSRHQRDTLHRILHTADRTLGPSRRETFRIRDSDSDSRERLCRTQE